MQQGRYSAETFQRALSAVRQNRLKVTAAAKQYGVPVSTLYDHASKTHNSTIRGPSKQLSDEEERSLVEFIIYMAKHGLPMTRAMIRCYIKEIIKKSGRDSLINMDKGPSDEWFRKFYKRHPQLSERKPEHQDKSRTRMSTRFHFSMGCLPHRTFSDGIPDSWLFASSESGYMDTDLFYQWFDKIFLKYCNRQRPVMLIMDNHDSHISLKVIEKAIENEIILVGLPGHTTHFLQPLDVKIIGPLKSRFSSMARNLGFVSQTLTIGKAKFPIVLKHAIDQATPASIQGSFRVTGICPLNADAIDKSQLVPSTFDNSTAQALDYSNVVRTCETCGTYLNNPLVQQGLISQSLADILVPPPTKPFSSKNRRIVANARVITGHEMLIQLKEKEELTSKKQEEMEKRKKDRELRREQKNMEMKERTAKRQKREEEKQKKNEAKRMKREETIRKSEIKVHENELIAASLVASLYVCSVCNEHGRVDDEENGLMWYGCDEDRCERWYHECCLKEREREDLLVSLEEGGNWYCSLCKPWLYEE